MSGETVRLGDFCELISEPVRPGARPDALYLGLEHLAPGRLTRIGGGKASEMRSNTSAFQPGDVLYGKLAHTWTKPRSLTNQASARRSYLCSVRKPTPTRGFWLRLFTLPASWNTPSQELLAFNTQEPHGRTHAISKCPLSRSANNKRLPICFGLCMK